MIESLLVANRGEIARRIIRTAKRLGIRVIAVHSEADADLPFVAEADEAVLIGPPNPALSYRNTEAILAAAKSTGAQAIHPGYGFLSENADFARTVEASGLIWVGPDADAITAMGDKINARNLMAAAGVPVAPGTTEPAADLGGGDGRRRDRLPGDGQGRRRRWRHGHGCGRRRGRAAHRVRQGARVRRADVRRWFGVDRAVLSPGAACRGADPRHGRWPGGGARRAGVLGAAAQSEAGRGVPVAGGLAGAAIPSPGGGGAGRRGGRLSQRGHGGVPARSDDR